MATVQTFALCSVSVVDNVPPRTPVVRYVRENISHDILYASNGEQVMGMMDSMILKRGHEQQEHADGENYCDGAKT